MDQCRVCVDLSPYEHMKHGRKKGQTLHQVTTIELLKEIGTQVMKTLGSGHPERVYHRAMITALNKKKVPHRSEVLSPIYFMGEIVGVGRCDLVLEGIAVEIKANARHPRKALPQLRKYICNLSRTEKRRYSGLIINFNQKTCGVQTWFAQGFTPCKSE